MIITALNGGLGNQMFQYAAGRALAFRLNVELKLDLSSYERQTDPLVAKRRFSLDNFEITAGIARDEEVEIFKKPKILTGLFNKKTYFKEKGMNFNNEFQDLSGDVFLDGYWQSEKYFSEIRDILHEEFQLKDKEELTRVFPKELEGSDSVSIHIRRSDYITNPTAANVLGFIGIEYYKKAIDYIRGKIQNPKFFVFSDDISWVKKNLDTGVNSYYMEGNPDHIDLSLMNLCKNNIIANSSFSWWGAYLNLNPEKIVIAPKNWFKDSKNYSSLDLIPNTWMQL